MYSVWIRQTTLTMLFANRNQLAGPQHINDLMKADVHFELQSKNGHVNVVPVHKIALAAVSDVFKRMFYGELAENGNVTIHDSSDGAFIEFLQYFYSGAIELTGENVAEVLYLGHKYNVLNCVEDCVEFLMIILGKTNVCTALHLALLFDHLELVDACETFVKNNIEAVFASIGFLRCDKTVMGHILKMDMLPCSEVEVYRASMAWVRAKSKENRLTKAMVMEHFGDLFYKICFASIQMEDFDLLQLEFPDLLTDEVIIVLGSVGLIPAYAEKYYPQFTREERKKSPE